MQTAEANPCIGKKFTLLTTNDMHSSFTGSGGPDAAMDSAERVGGYARIASAMKLLKHHYEEMGHEVLMLDAGDWYSGSLFQLLAPSGVQWAPEVEFFARAGYDAITLGNHDFEAGEPVLFKMFEKLEKLKLHLPIVSSNLRVKKQPNNEVPIGRLIRQKVQDYIVVTKGGIRFGIIGAMGPDAAFACSGTRTTIGFIGYDDIKQSKRFSDYAAHVTRTAQTVRPLCDVLILLAHQGTPEDKDLAETIPEKLIDIMVSGHTHECYLLQANGKRDFFDFGKSTHVTTLTQSLSHGRRVGVNSFEIKAAKVAHLSESANLNAEEKLLNLFDSERELPLLRSLLEQINVNKTFIDINKSIISDPAMAQQIDLWMEDIIVAKKESLTEADSTYYHFKINQVVYQSNDIDLDIFPLPMADRLFIAPLFCSLMLNEINEFHIGDQRQPIEVYLHAPRAMRDVLKPAKNDAYILQYSDIFRVLSMTGLSPVCTFYLSIEALTKLLEILPILRSVFSPEIAMCFSNTLTWEENEWGIPFINKIHNVRINGVVPEKSGLVHIATNYFIGEWFWKVKEITRGLVDLKPTNSLGEEISFAQRANALLKPHLFEPDLVAGALDRLARSKGGVATNNNNNNANSTAKSVANISTASSLSTSISEKSGSAVTGKQDVNSYSDSSFSPSSPSSATLGSTIPAEVNATSPTSHFISNSPTDSQSFSPSSPVAEKADEKLQQPAESADLPENDTDVVENDVAGMGDIGARPDTDTSVLATDYPFVL